MDAHVDGVGFYSYMNVRCLATSQVSRRSNQSTFSFSVRFPQPNILTFENISNYEETSIITHDGLIICL